MYFTADFQFESDINHRSDSMLVFQKNWREHIRNDPQKGCRRAGIDFKWLAEIVAEINMYLPDDWRLTRSKNNFRIDIVADTSVSLVGHAFRTDNDNILNIIDTVFPTKFIDTEDLKNLENKIRRGLKASTKKTHPETVVPNLYFFRPGPAKSDSPLFARQYERVKKNKTGEFGGDQYHRIHPLTKAGLDLMHFRWIKWNINGNTCLVDAVHQDYHGKNYWDIIPELNTASKRGNAEEYLGEYEKILLEYNIHPQEVSRPLLDDSFQIEYKYLVPGSSGDAGAVYKTIEECIDELGFSVIERPSRSTEQIDDYYDDAAFSLHNAGASFRVRKKSNDNILVSLKKRKPIEDIYARSGLYERIEEEAVISLSQENDLKRGNPVNILPYRLLPFIAGNLGALQHVMTVHNQRKTFVLQDDTLRKINLCMDRVTYEFGAGSPGKSFFELEIQSRGSSKERTRQLAEYISENLGLIPSGQSKYERGLSLLKTGKTSDRKKKVIIDTDCGVDDALALILALKSDELDVLAITTVSGNVHVDQVNQNVDRILKVLPYEKNLILAQGADRPLKSKERKEAGSVHGEDGLGDIQDHSSGKPLPLDDRPAWKLICDLAREHTREITLITLGPLTNLALAIEKEPDSVRHLQEVVSMGGVFFDVGNVGPDAEFNVMADPDAARNVVRFCRDSCRKIAVDKEGRPVDLPENPSQKDFEKVKDFLDRNLPDPDMVPLTFIGLDVTHRVALRRSTLDHAVKSSPGNHVIEFVQKISKKYMDFYFGNEGLDGCYLHDPLAVGFVINPAFLRIEKHIIRVETQGAFTSGMIFPDDRPTTNWAWKNPAEKVIGVARQVERESFEEFFLKRIME
jgi:purine nucleosidase